MKEKNLSQVPKSGVTKREIMIIAIVVGGAFIAILNQTVLSPALPKLMETFQINAGTAQWVTTIYMLVNGIMVPVTAYLIDRFATKLLFIISMAVFIVGTLVTGMAGSFPILIIGRIMQAMGAGIQLPLVAYVPMLVFPREKRGTAMGMAGIVMSCAPAIGPVFAGWIIDRFGWRMMFYSIIPLAIVILVLSIFLLENVGERKRPHLDLLSIVLSSFAFWRFVVRIFQCQHEGVGQSAGHPAAAHRGRCLCLVYSQTVSSG